MDNLVKGVIKAGTAIIAIAFGGKVGKEAMKNMDAWKKSRNQIQQKNK